MPATSSAPLRELFVDFNSFFASVEQQDRPELRGVPVAVVPLMAETTCCIALSQEAKKLGLRGGMRVFAARRACPTLQVIEARPPLYVEYHQRLKKIIDSCVPVGAVHSIDEVSCPLTGPRQQRAEAVALAKRIKQTLAREAGEYLRCSIGIAPNLLLAKAASDMEKPDGLVVIEAHELPERLHGLELQHFSGVGKRMLLRLQKAGIENVRQLCTLPRPHLRKIWGSVEGERFYDALRGGIHTRPATQKSVVGHSHVLSPKQRNPEDARAVLHRLLQKAARRLRLIRHYTRGLQFFIEYCNSGGWSAELRFLETQDTLVLSRALDRLWQQRPPSPQPPLMVGVSLFNLLDEKNHTPSLFNFAGEEENLTKSRRLSTVVDQINSRLGKNAVYFGAAHGALQSAPMRIAFNFVPGVEFSEGKIQL